MDISKLASDTTTIEIKHPGTGAPIGITVEVRSPECDEIKVINRAWQNRALKSRGKEIDATEIEKQALDVMVASIASWEWADGLEWEGEKPDNSDAFKRKVLSSKSGAFILRQVDKAMGDEARFFGG